MNEKESLRNEILLCNWQLYITSLVILVLMGACALLARVEKFADIIVFVPVLGIGWAFAMGRYEYLIHRVGAFLKQEGSEWESSEPRKRRLWLLAFADLGSMMPFLFLFGYGTMASWNLGYHGFVTTTTIAFLLGIASIPFSATSFK